MKRVSENEKKKKKKKLDKDSLPRKLRETVELQKLGHRTV